MKNDYLKKLVEIFDGSVDANDDLSKYKQEHCRANDGGKKMFLGIPPELFPYRIQVPIILGLFDEICSTFPLHIANIILILI